MLTASACTYSSENIAIWGCLGTSRLLQPTTKQALTINMEKMEFLPPSDPSLVFERETYMAYPLQTAIASGSGLED